MIPVSFDYLRPSTVEDAVAALADAGGEAKILAGGQSLLGVLRLRLAAPSLLVDLGGLGQLRGIRVEDDDLVVGAMTTHAEVASSPLVLDSAPLLAAAAGQVGDRQVRHRGTLGGALAHADPAGDLASVVVAHGGSCVVAGVAGRRVVPASEFFVDYFTTALGSSDVLVEVRLPRLVGWGVRYEKFHRTAQAWATVGVAAAVRRSNGTIAEARVALANMAPTPVRASTVESAVLGPATADAIAAAALLAADGTRPASDLAASAEYRTHLARVLTGRALSAAAGL